MIHLTTPSGQRIWCDEREHDGLIRTDVISLCTCVPCLEKLADHHRLGAASAMRRICEVIS